MTLRPPREGDDRRNWVLALVHDWDTLGLTDTSLQTALEKEGYNPSPQQTRELRKAAGRYNQLKNGPLGVPGGGHLGELEQAIRETLGP